MTMQKDIKPFEVSIFTKDGKKVEGITHANCLKPFGELSPKMDWKQPQDFSFNLDIMLSESKEEMKAIKELLYKDVEKQLGEFYAKVWEMVEHIMQNYVTPPIKGEITKGKVRWRNLQIVWQETDSYDAFVGIRQRDMLILPDGKKIPWDNLVNI